MKRLNETTDVYCYLRACIEVSEGDSVIGYAVFFSGGWDAWVMRNRRGHRLFRKATNVTQEAAIEAIKETWERQK